MNSILFNKFFSSYLINFILELCVYLSLLKIFDLKISKHKAFLFALICSNYLPISNTLSYLIIGEGYITETPEVLLAIQLITYLEELIIIAFICLVLDIVWYKCYWLTIIMHFFILLPSIIYGNFFIKQNAEHEVVIHPVTTQTFTLYIFILLFSILWGWLLLFLSKYITKLKIISKISRNTYLILYMGWMYLLFNTNKSYQTSNSNINYNNNDIWRNVDGLGVALFAVFAIISIVLITISYSDKKILKMENCLLKEQNELQYAYYLDMQEQEIKIHKLYHDIGNHINTIKLLVNNNDIKEAKEYTENLAQQYQSINKRKFCCNNIINAVITQKIDVCYINGYSFECDIKIPTALPISDIDLMSLYSNLLDNAIEACQQNSNTDNYIHLHSSIIGDYLAVKVVNSKSILITTSKNTFITTKKDKSMHGYGLRIIDEIIERYDGQKEFLDNGKEFSSFIMLKLNI